MSLRGVVWLLLGASAASTGAAGCSPDESARGGAGGMLLTSGGASSGSASPTLTGGTSVGGRASGGQVSGDVGGSDVGGSAGGEAAGGSNLGGEAPSGGTGSGGRTGGTPEVCSFEISASLSEEIGTVGIVQWSTDLQDLTDARIEFELVEPQPGEVNVQGSGAIAIDRPQALLLGLKPGRKYTYHIVARSGDVKCVSLDEEIETAPDLEASSDWTRTTRSDGPAHDSRSAGYIVTCRYNTTHGQTLIVDSDGDVVWRAEGPNDCSRAHIDWAGEYMWMIATNPSARADQGGAWRVRLDGSGAEELSGLDAAHHDFTVLPDGVVTFLVGTDTDASDVIERSPGGTLRTVARLNQFLAPAGGFHTNAIRYHAASDSYTVGDLRNGIISLTREGQIQWQVTPSTLQNPLAHVATGLVFGNHGHQLLQNGNLLYFCSLAVNGATTGSPVYELKFTEKEDQLTAQQVWSFTPPDPGDGPPYSTVLGDVQRVGETTWITYSTEGLMHQVTSAGELIQSLQFYPFGRVGYATFRRSLYGPPDAD